MDPHDLAGYFDWASTAPLHPAARRALLQALEAGWADPARRYGAARRARIALDDARAHLAHLLGAPADGMYFPASGTAAVHTALQGALRGRRRAGPRLVHSAVEHSSVLHVAERHVAELGEAEAVPVNGDGRVDPEVFAAAVRRPGVAVASLQSANHEVGARQPVAAAAEAAAAAGVPLHIDAAQSAGREALPERWDLLTASAHKWGGPPGVGVLAVRTGTRFPPVGPRDERGAGRVPGFENVPAIVAAAAALAAREGERVVEAARLATLTEHIRAEIARRIPDAVLLGPTEPAARLPHLVTCSFLYVDGEALLAELDRAGFAVHSGS
ncbi:MAG: cysteine desulfurase family protein, partial [Mycobacteriales bacterium]